jgi:hypothetical protein
MATQSKNQVPAWVNSHNLLVALLILMVLFFVFAAGAAVGRASDNFEGPHKHHKLMRSRPPARAQGGIRNPLDGNQSVITGAVIKISGANFTVAGGGTTTEVKTSSTTQYKGASMVKLNDTVIVIGTKTSSSFQANRVVVNPIRNL